MEGAQILKSDKHFNEAYRAHSIMRAAWPGEPRIKELREQFLRLRHLMHKGGISFVVWPGFRRISGNPARRE
jgi:hypothetical protein